jgi:hypothetical protein
MKENSAMIALQVSGAVLAALVIAQAAIAGEPPAPRQPIGPTSRGQDLQMLPPQLPTKRELAPLSEDRIRIFNIGDQQLFISYWDGESAWRAASIDAGGSRDVVCSKCAGTITVAYHDGKANQSVKTAGGSTYLLGWSAQAGAWILTSSLK